MNSYSIYIPNDKATAYKWVTFIMLFINLLGFGFIFLNTAANSQKNLSIIGMSINNIALVIFLLQFYSKKDFLKIYRVEIIFIINALLWLIIGKYLLAILLIAFAVFCFYSNKKSVINFSPEGIRYPSFPSKLFLWADTEQVMLKDDILTIDLKNNKLLQFALDRQNTVAIDEAAFNEFCKVQSAAEPSLRGTKQS